MTHERYPLIALVGRPNVGKSSLFNRLAKTRKAIVDSMPGVTRDRHYEKVTWNNKVFMLVDTGGIENDQRQIINRLIQEQTWQAVGEADVILFLLDGREGLLPEDHDVAKVLRRSGKRVFYLVNKIDSPAQEELLLPAFYELGVDSLWPVSAAHGYGVKSFLNELTEGLGAEAVEMDLSPDTISLACIGRPNVGKSSLINRLVGEERMVVSDIPGTTRDSVDTLLERKNKRYLLIDTAGIRRKGKVREKIEKFSVMQALGALERCDLAFILVDAEEGITEQDTKVVGYGLDRGRACLVLINKWDLLKEDKKRQKRLLEEVQRLTNFAGFVPIQPVSALTGFGVKKLFPMIDAVHAQYCREFSTATLNRVLRTAIEAHTPPMHKGKRLKFYYTTQVAAKPPTFVIFVNYPKGVHFSYYRYLTNQFRGGLGLDKIPIKIILRERQRKQYG